MPSEVRVVDQKFYYQLRNGDTFTENTSDFTTHLKGNILEKVKAVFNVQVQWYYHFQGNGAVSTYWNNTANTYIINARGVDFIANGFSIGDDVKHTNVNWDVRGQVTAISDGEIFLSNVTVIGTLASGVWGEVSAESYLTGLGNSANSQKTALEYKFGLIEQNESFNTLSKLTNTNQIFRVSGIDHNNPLTFSDGESFGNNKAWVTGSMKCAFVGYSIDKDFQTPENTTQEFQIEHEFMINPFYRDGDLDSLKGDDVPPLDIFNGEKSLKYVFEAEFRTEISNPNTSMITQYDTQLGSVGYFNENYNGFQNNYSSDSLVYTVGGDTVDKIESSAVTSVTLNINDSLGNFSANTKIIIGHASIIDSDKYSNSTKEYNELWNNENIRTQVLTSPVSNNYIKNFVATLSSASLMVVSFDVDLTTAETEDGQNYILYYGVEEEDLTPDLSGKITGLVDVNQYYKNSDIDGLWNLNKFEQYPHAEDFVDGVSVGFTNTKGFNETGYMLDAEFTKDAEATLESLSFEVVVYNTVTKEISTLRSLEVDLSSQIVTGTSNLIIQNLVIDSTRGYVLKDTDQFNFLKLENNLLDYSLQIGYKMPWQEWAKWKQAPNDFYDRNKPQDGLNQKASNYSDTVANYELRVITRVELLKDGVVTEYVSSSEKMEVFDYDTDDQTPDAYSCEISTYNSTGDKLEGNIIEKDFTELRASFVPENPPVFSETVDFTEVSTLWNRFASGEVLTNVPFGLERIPLWLNGQADDNDTFGNGTATSYTKNDAALYSSTPSSILSNQNCNAYYGCYSLEEFSFYEIDGEMYSNDVDNDGLGYVIAFHVDEEGKEHTLSLIATTGGINIGLNPNFDVNNPSSGQVNSIQTFGSPTPSANWGLVYNYGKRDCQILEQFYTTSPSDLGWNSPLVQDLKFEVKRRNNEVDAFVDWTIDGVQYTNTFNYNLFDNAITEKFTGFQRYGFAFASQNQGGFKNVIISVPTGDYYGILRMENEDSLTDFNINELSTVREAPEGSLLKQITGTERKALLSWDGSAFVLQGEIDTENLNEGEKYKFSAELRTLNLDESISL
jgi:hypothetical protein